MAASSSSTPSHLEPSQLGTKEYWDNLYTTEITNHAANPSDEGTVWFDDSDAEARMLSHLDALTESAPFDHEIRHEDASFLDLGCGNGSLLFALRDEGWNGRLMGVDYSRRSVELARQIAKARRENPGKPTKSEDDEEDDETMGDDDAAADEAQTEQQQQQQQQPEEEEERVEDDPEREIEFAEWDVLNGDLPTVLSGTSQAGWDVILDKGTFDAICLSSETDPATGRRVCEGYRPRVLRLLKKGGLFLVTSCNWTEDELRAWFDHGDSSSNQDNGKLVTVGKVEYPSFQFGGVKGQTISTLCFQKQ